MLELPLQPLPRQSFEVTLGGRQWAIRIIQVSPDQMAIDVTIDLQPVVLGVRCTPGAPVLQYDHLRAQFGDLAWDGVPWWSYFGTPACSLLWASPGELGYV